MSSYNRTQMMVGHNISVSSGITRYFGNFNTSGLLVLEPNLRVILPKCRVVGIKAFIPTNSGAGPLTFTLWKNGVATTMTFTVPALSTGSFVTYTNPVDFADGDAFTIEAAGTASLIVGSLLILLDGE